MDRLIEGFREFRASYYAENRDLFARLAQGGQSPSHLVIACSDSRVDPAIIFNASPGDIFVVRNVANIVPPYSPDSGYHGTSAALEFAVLALGVRHIIVLGHRRCGGVRALIEQAEGPCTDFVGPWMAVARPARERALAAAASPEEAWRLCEHETVKVSLGNLTTFPWVRERIADGRLELHGCYFDIDTGELLCLDAEGVFHPLP